MEKYQTAQVSLTLLSPVHIGCGDAYDPTCYLIGDDGILYAFEPSLVDLPEAKRDELKCLGQTGTVFEWARFFYRNRDLYVSAARTAMEAGKKICQYYGALVEERRSQSQCLISRTAYTTSGEEDVPYIPGSSVKGAIHTALADRINDGRGDVFRGVGKSFNIDEKVIKGTFTQSPMRFVKVADFMPLQPVSKRAVYAQRLTKSGGSAAPNVIRAAFETLWPGIYRSFVSQWSLSGAEPVYGICYPYRNFQGIANDLNKKTFPIFVEECSFLEKFARANGWAESVRHLVDSIRNELDAGTIALIRLGRNQGAASVVLKGSPSPNAKPKEQFFVIDDGLMLPFGWALLEFKEQENARIKAWCAEQTPVRIINLAAVRKKRLTD